MDSIIISSSSSRSLLPLHAQYHTLWSRPKCETLCCRKSNDANIWWRQHVDSIIMDL